MSNSESILQDLKKHLADLSAPQLQVFAERDVDLEYELNISAFRAVIDEEEVILAAVCDVIDAHNQSNGGFQSAAILPHLQFGVWKRSHGQENPPLSFPTPS